MPDLPSLGFDRPAYSIMFLCQREKEPRFAATWGDGKKKVCEPLGATQLVLTLAACRENA